MNEFEIEIQPMTVFDIADSQRIAEECNLAFWSVEGFRTEIENLDSVCLIVKYKEETIGFLIARLIISEKHIEIFNIGIKLKYRRLKIATKLIKILKTSSFLPDKWDKIYLEVRKSNLAAIKFYSAEQFSAVGERKKIYQNPVDNAIVMCFTKNIKFENSKLD